MPQPEITIPAGADVPALVEHAMTRYEHAHGAALCLPHGSHLEEATRADRLAELCEHRAAWWAVLLRWSFTADCRLPWIFGAAVIDAAKHEESSARFWREIATDAHAEHAAHVEDDLSGVVAGRAS